MTLEAELQAIADEITAAAGRLHALAAKLGDLQRVPLEEAVEVFMKTAHDLPAVGKQYSRGLSPQGRRTTC